MSFRTCPGCRRAFSLPGLKHHLDRTTQADCIAARDELAALEERDDRESGQQDPSSSPSWLDRDDLESDHGDPPAFEGDYYGYYEEGELVFPDDQELDLPSDHSDSDLDSCLDLEDNISEPGWEPPVDEMPPLDEPMDEEEEVPQATNPAG